MTDMRQVAEPCPYCGSYYRNGDRCNKCHRFVAEIATDAGILNDGNDPIFSMAGHAPRGADWDKKSHRVIRRKTM